MKSKVTRWRSPYRRRTGTSVLCFVCSTTALAAATPTMDEMWDLLQRQQRELETLKTERHKDQQAIERLKKENERLKGRLQETDEKVDATAEMQEQAATQPHSEAASWAERTRLGAYGELHYRNLDSKNEIDFRRFVLFFGHRFTDRIRFWSELELEHALTGAGAEGELELEQAFLEFDLTATQRLRTGLYLVPVGILNETHEPTTFYGVERNPVERNIIPTTWWEGAIGVTGRLPVDGESPFAQGWSYDLMLGSGLNSPLSGSNAFLIRSGRQKVSKAKANDGAVTARIRWRGVPGIEWAATGQYQTDVTQGALDIGATLLETHLDARRGPVGLRALWAGWWLDDGPLGLGPKSGPSPGRERQTGWYVEPSYRLDLPGRLPGELGLFARYNQWNNNAGSGGTADKEQVDVGFNYWPISDVVFKFDYQEQLGAVDDDGFSLGLGFQF